MLNIGPQELLLILVVALLVVGPRRLPELGRSLGRGLRELRKAQDEVRKTIQVNLEDERPTTARGGKPTMPEASHAADETGGAAAAGGTSSEGTGDVADVSRTLGRGLAELRRAREEIQRSFRVDLGEVRPPPTRPRKRDRPPSSSEDPAPAGEASGAAGDPGGSASG